MLEENVVSLPVADGKCFVCEREIKSDRAIQVKFIVPTFLKDFEVERLMHVVCGKMLSDLILRRIEEARNYAR